MTDALVDITHVIVDARLRYGDVLKYLKQETIPVVTPPNIPTAAIP